MINFTPLPSFLYSPKNQTQTPSFSKEGEPTRTEASPAPDLPEEEKYIELEQHGVKVRKESISLPPSLKKIGLTPVGNSQFPQSYNSVRFIISDEKIIKGLHEPFTSSFHWLAEFGLYFFRKAHIGLRVIGKHVVRVVLR